MLRGGAHWKRNRSAWRPMRLANGKTQRALPTFIKILIRTEWYTGDCCRVNRSLHGKRQTARRKRNETTPLDFDMSIARHGSRDVSRCFSVNWSVSFSANENG